MKSICVFCGSGNGNQKVYSDAAKELGSLLAAQDISLVYGGAQVGLMGMVADAVLSGKGKVTGIIPHFLAGKEIVHHHLTELITVDSMHERKNRMAMLSDGFIALPGGIGTLEELFEIFSWDYLKLHQKPVGLLNVNGFYDHLLNHLNFSVTEGFLGQPQLDRLLVADSPKALLALMQQRAIKNEMPLEGDKT